MRWHTRLLPFALLWGSLSLTACGGGGSGSRNTTAPPPAPPQPLLAMEAPAGGWSQSLGGTLPLTYQARLRPGEVLDAWLDKDGRVETDDDRSLLRGDLPDTGGDRHTLRLPPPPESSNLFLLLLTRGVTDPLHAVSDTLVRPTNRAWVLPLGEGPDEARDDDRSLHLARRRDGGVVAASDFVRAARLGEGQPGQVDLDAPAEDQLGIFIAAHDEAGTLDWHVVVQGVCISMDLCVQHDGAITLAGLIGGPVSVQDTAGTRAALGVPAEAGVRMFLLTLEPDGRYRHAQHILMAEPEWWDMALHVASRGPEGGVLLVGQAHTTLTANPGRPDAITVLENDVPGTPFIFVFDVTGHAVAGHGADPMPRLNRITDAHAHPEGGAVVGVAAFDTVMLTDDDDRRRAVARAGQVGWVRLDAYGRVVRSWALDPRGGPGLAEPAVAVDAHGEVSMLMYAQPDEDLLLGGDPDSVLVMARGEAGRVLLRFDDRGRPRWAHRLRSTPPFDWPDAPWALAARNDGSVVAAISDRDGWTFEDGASVPSRGDEQIVTLALDADGQRLFHRRDGGAALDWVQDLIVLPDGSPVLSALYLRGNSIWGIGEPAQRGLGGSRYQVLVRLNANGDM